MQTSVKNFRDHLHDYLRWVQNGENVIITSHKRPIAKISPIEEEDVEKKIFDYSDFLLEIEQLHKSLRKVKQKSSMRQAILSARKNERF